MYEIERKFLIRFPYGIDDIIGITVSDIIQTYLCNPCNSERVRKRIYNNRTEYTHTEKIKVSDLTRIEKETEISEQEYLQFLQRQNQDLSVIEKKRYCYPYKGYNFEIDVYPFWNDRAVMEVELENESSEFEIPESISVIKEISTDKRYTNHSLARNIPYDDIDY